MLKLLWYLDNPGGKQQYTIYQGYSYKGSNRGHGRGGYYTNQQKQTVYLCALAAIKPEISDKGSLFHTDFPKLAEKLSVIRTDRHEDLVSPKNILVVRKKIPKKFTVMCIMFSLAF